VYTGIQLIRMKCFCYGMWIMYSVRLAA